MLRESLQKVAKFEPDLLLRSCQLPLKFVKFGINFHFHYVKGNGHEFTLVIPVFLFCHSASLEFEEVKLKEPPVDIEALVASTYLLIYTLKVLYQIAWFRLFIL